MITEKTIQRAIDNKEFMTFLEYEIAGHWLTGYLGFDCLQRLSASYHVWQTKRKYAKYKQFLAMQENKK